MPPPIADHSAMARVRAAPDHRAVISARVVGKASPADSPPSSRAANSTSKFGAAPAIRHAGIESTVPSTSSRLRP